MEQLYKSKCEDVLAGLSNFQLLEPFSFILSQKKCDFLVRRPNLQKWRISVCVKEADVVFERMSIYFIV